MNPFEQSVRSAYEQHGYKVISCGWPDFLIYSERALKNGTQQPQRLFAVEAKSASDELRPEQKAVHAILNHAGIPVLVVRPDDLAEIKRSKPGGKFLHTAADYRYLINQFNEIETHLAASLSRFISEAESQITEIEAMKELIRRLPTLCDEPDSEATTNAKVKLQHLHNQADRSREMLEKNIAQARKNFGHREKPDYQI